MSKLFLILAIVFILPLQVCCLSRQTTLELYKRQAYNQVAMVEVEFEVVNEAAQTVSHPSITATAFAVDKIHLATAGHFCMGAFEMSMRSKSVKPKITYVDKNEELTESPNFKIIAIDVKNDLCILEKANHGLVPVIFPKDFKLKIRDKIFTVGAPHSTFPIETEGHVSVPFIFSTSEELNGKIMCSLGIYSGNSGSPVFNSKGEIIGIIVMGSKQYINIAFLTNSKYLVTLLERY
jgi:hypothetical protein